MQSDVFRSMVHGKHALHLPGNLSTSKFLNPIPKYYWIRMCGVAPMPPLDTEIADMVGFAPPEYRRIEISNITGGHNDAAGWSGRANYF